LRRRIYEIHIKIVLKEKNPVSTTVTTEKRKRGFFGWVFLLVFWLWQIIMIVTLVSGLSGSSGVYDSATSDAGRAGAAIGTGLGVTAILVFWCLGTIILGFLVMFSRGKKILITHTKQNTI
jgi:hypothetical protein